MKKTIAVVVALLFLLGFASFTFAQENTYKSTKATEENMQIIIGKVFSVDKVTKTIRVMDSAQTNKSFTVSDKVIAKVKEGDEVKVKFKAGSTNAQSVTIVKTEGKNEKEEVGEKVKPRGDK